MTLSNLFLTAKFEFVIISRHLVVKKGSEKISFLKEVIWSTLYLAFYFPNEEGSLIWSPEYVIARALPGAIPPLIIKAQIQNPGLNQNYTFAWTYHIYEERFMRKQSDGKQWLFSLSHLFLMERELVCSVHQPGL